MARSAPSARRASRCSREGAGRPPRRAVGSESVPRSGGRGAGNGEGVARSAWRGAQFSRRARGNRGRPVGASGSRSARGEGGRVVGRARLREWAGRRDVWSRRLSFPVGRHTVQAGRLEAKGERRRWMRKRRTSSVAARGVPEAARREERGRLHERAQRRCEGVAAPTRERREALGTQSTALRRPGEERVETREALIEDCEAPGRAREALRSRGEDSRGISRSPRTGARARAVLRRARLWGAGAPRAGRADLGAGKGRSARAFGASRRV